MGYWENMMLHRPIDCVGDATVVSALPLGLLVFSVGWTASRSAMRPPPFRRPPHG